MKGFIQAVLHPQKLNMEPEFWRVSKRNLREHWDWFSGEPCWISGEYPLQGELSFSNLLRVDGVFTANHHGNSPPEDEPDRTIYQFTANKLYDVS